MFSSTINRLNIKFLLHSIASSFLFDFDVFLVLYFSLELFYDYFYFGFVAFFNKSYSNSEYFRNSCFVSSIQSYLHFNYNIIITDGTFPGSTIIVLIELQINKDPKIVKIINNKNPL